MGTELAPAISLAYEPAEEDIMNMPPRKRSQHLMTWPLIAYAYLIISSFITAGCFVAYFWVFWLNGIYVGDLFWSSSNGYFQPPSSNLSGKEKKFCSNGHCFDAKEQEKIQRQACTAFYLSIVMAQVKID